MSNCHFNPNNLTSCPDIVAHDTPTEDVRRICDLAQTAFLDALYDGDQIIDMIPGCSLGFMGEDPAHSDIVVDYQLKQETP